MPLPPPARFSQQNFSTTLTIDLPLFLSFLSFLTYQHKHHSTHKNNNMNDWGSIRELSCERSISTDAEANSPTRHVPLELIQEIFWYLTPSEYDSARLVCKRWFGASLSSPLLLHFLRIMNFPSNIRTFSEAKLRRWELGDLRLAFAFAIEQWTGSTFRARLKKIDLNLSAILRNTHTDSGYSSREIEFINFSQNPGGYMGMVTKTVEGPSKVQRTLWIHGIAPIECLFGLPIPGSGGWLEDSGLSPMLGVDVRPGNLYLAMELKKCPDQPILGLDIEPGGSEPGIVKIRVRYLNNQESVSFDWPLQIGQTRGVAKILLDGTPYDILCRGPGITYRTGPYRLPLHKTSTNSVPNIPQKVLRAIFGYSRGSDRCSPSREPTNSFSRQAARFMLGSFTSVTRSAQASYEPQATTYMTLPLAARRFHYPDITLDQALRRLPCGHGLPKPKSTTLRERVGKLSHKVIVQNPGPMKSQKMANLPSSHVTMAIVGDDPALQMCHRWDISLEHEFYTVLVTPKNDIIICSLSTSPSDIEGVEDLDARYCLSPPPRMWGTAKKITHVSIAPWHEDCYFGHGLKWWSVGICAGYDNGEVWFWKADMDNLRQKIPGWDQGAIDRPVPDADDSPSASHLGSMYLPLPYFATRGECISMSLSELAYTTGKKIRQTKVHLPAAGSKKAESRILGFMPGLMKLSFIGRGETVAAVTEKSVVIFDMGRGGSYETGSVKGIFR
ncbi:hypothetical protein L873DRAFT_386892 [Choiromyces venosus 120613-1]|uniref:F-box domain-containing protein n=1 Tax=Choiromyces venosus 120613-1 TaxID=1336337 RepID=A0A3N4IXN0_9PEZI|nr:hypothetical protein L873DRAFT_386892 [Choiromyces venosus 120613-1]